MKYQLSLTQTQMERVSAALEMAARLEAGQFDIAAQHLVHRMRVELDQQIGDRLEERLNGLGRDLTQVLKLSHANPRPANFWILHEATRHSLWLQRSEENRAVTRSCVDAYPARVLYSCQEAPPDITVLRPPIESEVLY